MPASDGSTRHTIRVAAPPGRVFQAARSAELTGPRFVRVLMAIRLLPAAAAELLRGRRPVRRARCDRSIGDLHFTVVAETPGEEIVLGIMGRFWTPSGGVIAAEPGRFRTPPPPGLAQGLWSFRVEPSGDGTLLSTETRVRCGDVDTRRRFLRYWRLVRPGSGMIRRSLLRQIRSTAERQPA